MSALGQSAGGYAFAPGVFQYSAGVVADPGHEIVHVRFARPVPLADGFQRIADHLSSEGRPRTAFCACEIRSPGQFSEAGFRAFNETYVGTLTEWGLFADGVNPVARSNVCPEVGAPPTPSFHAFAYARPADDAARTGIVAGSGEVPEGKANYADHIVAPGDVSPDGMRAKAAFVVRQMTDRLAALGLEPADVTAAQVYTVEPWDALLADVIRPSGLAGHGLVWHPCRPPIEGLAFEMDCRVVRSERVID